MLLCITKKGVAVHKLSIGDNKVNIINICEIECKGCKLRFNKQYDIKFYIEDGYYFAEDSTLGISCYGESYSDLLEDVKENIEANWEMYVDCNINELSNDAVKLRERLIL